jgi:hypothetical protein
VNSTISILYPRCTPWSHNGLSRDLKSDQKFTRLQSRRWQCLKPNIFAWRSGAHIYPAESVPNGAKCAMAVAKAIWLHGGFPRSPSARGDGVSSRGTIRQARSHLPMMGEMGDLQLGAVGAP